jgi:hypothetical protein
MSPLGIHTPSDTLRFTCLRKGWIYLALCAPRCGSMGWVVRAKTAEVSLVCLLSSSKVGRAHVGGQGSSTVIQVDTPAGSALAVHSAVRSSFSPRPHVNRVKRKVSWGASTKGGGFEGGQSLKGRGGGGL